MDSLITAAARALATGDPLRALDCVALRDDPPALALRGIAMAQLGDFVHARKLLARAARAFGDEEPVQHARCLVSLAEVALASRRLDENRSGLQRAIRRLESQGDTTNALVGKLTEVRHRILLGNLASAAELLNSASWDAAPPRLAAAVELARAQIAIRRLEGRRGRAALLRARAHAENARVPALLAEVDVALRSLDEPAARLVGSGTTRYLVLEAVEALLESDTWVVDGGRRALRHPERPLDLARRPILFALLRAMATAWPGDVTREALISSVFGVQRFNDSHRARLRVEVGRLRKLLAKRAGVEATGPGYRLSLGARERIVVLAPPFDTDAAGLLALLADGDSWSTSALALALGKSQRWVQRALAGLELAGKAYRVGSGRSHRWVADAPDGFATSLLLARGPVLG